MKSLFVVFLFVVPISAFSQTADATLFKEVFTHYLDSGLSGSVLIAKGDKVLLKESYGYADRGTKKANMATTLYNVASIGKQFTAYCVLQLELQGRLKTIDYVSKYIGAFHDARDSCTIHHLLIHSSGLMRGDADLDYSTRENFIRSVKASKMDSAPGTSYRYSNAGYSLLAAIAEIASGMPFEQLLQEIVFVPAGMDHTGYPWEARMQKTQFAVGYDKAGNAVPTQPNIWAARGPGNVLTSTEDLYRWMTAWRTRVPPAIRDKMLTDYLPGKETYSWNKTTTASRKRLYHKGGGRSDFESQLMWLPDDDLVIIFLINNDLNLRGKIFRKLSSIL